MHPAPSVILFTSLSGLGFGLLFFLGLGMPASTGLVAFVFYAIAYGLCRGGVDFLNLPLGTPRTRVKGVYAVAFFMAQPRGVVGCHGALRQWSWRNCADFL